MCDRLVASIFKLSAKWLITLNHTKPEDKAWETEESAYTIFGSDNQMEILIS